MTLETALSFLQYEIMSADAAYNILKKDSRSQKPGSIFENYKAGCFHRVVALEKIYDTIQDEVVSKSSAWVTLESEDSGDLYSCASCGMVYKDRSSYCPNCGKRMLV